MSRHLAQRLPRHRGVAAWSAILGPQGPADPLSAETTADVVIVGAGFAGLSAARRLLQLDPGLDVVVLEAGRVAEGAAGRNSGFMIDLPHELTSSDYNAEGAGGMTALNRQAIAFARDAVRDYQIAPAFFDPSGKINGAGGAAADAHNRSYAKALEAMGEAHELFDAQAMAEITGSRFYRSGLYTPGTVMLQPAGYVRGLADGLRAQVAIHEESAVTALVRQSGDWRVETKGGAVSAPRVILATNGHLESFGFARGRLMHVMLYASMTPVLPKDALKGRPRWGVTPSDAMGTTVRRIDAPQGGDRIVTRTYATLRSGMEAHARDLRRATRRQRAKFDVRFPELAGMAPEFEWAGHLCLTLNGVGMTGELEPGLFAATVQNGLGTARGTLAGIAAAEMATGADSAITAHFQSEPRPKRLPPRAVRDMGANAVLRWKEWRAGPE